MTFENSGRHTNIDIDKDIFLDGEIFEVVSFLQYLGVYFFQNGKIPVWKTNQVHKNKYVYLRQMNVYSYTSIYHIIIH